MNPERLLRHFDRIADAPDAIPRLRRFILDLAVRGKMVEQDPNDEPASALLKRIQVEQRQFVKENPNKEGFTSLDEEDTPFSLPASWSWSRFIEVASIESNLVKPDSFPDHPHIAPDNIEGRTGRLLQYQTIRESRVFSAKHRFFPGHILYSKIRPNLAKATLVDFEGLCSADMYPIRPFIDRAFLLRFMLSEAFVTQSIKEDNRVAMPKINQESLSKILVGVPPLSEQHRIVARVDELMGLCDRLVASQAERKRQRDRLVASSLHRLNWPAQTPGVSESDDFRAHARFHFNNLPRLTTRPEHIKQLRQTILNLAVRGKLVPQDPNDEPASELLKRAMAGKDRLLKKGRIKKPKLFESIRLSALPFKIPAFWKWIRLGQVSSLITKGSTPTSYGQSFVQSGINFIKVEAIKDGKLCAESITSYITEETHQFLKRSQLASGDFLFSIAGSIGTCAIVTEAVLPANTNQALAIIRGTNAAFLDVFLQYATRSGLLESALAKARGGAMNNISLEDINNFLLPLPPLAEQHRIVAKVNELMSLCDQLEAQLTGAQSDSRRLLEAVLHEALAQAT